MSMAAFDINCGSIQISGIIKLTARAIGVLAKLAAFRNVQAT